MSPTGRERLIDTTICSETVLQLRESFASRIVGQNDAVVAFTETLENYLGGFNDPRRPIGSLLFLGPTGTGKTSSVEAFCEGMFGFRDAMVKIDCGEFAHSHEVAKLIGSPPGYHGHLQTPARLTQHVLSQYEKPDRLFNVVLFDEIEKASDELRQLLLGILDKGLVTLGDNTTTNFTRSIIVMTSNVGAGEMSTAQNGGLGFNPGNKAIPDSEVKEIAFAAAKRKFTPEFLNRIDRKVMFNTLTEDQIAQVLDLELDYFQTRLFIKQTSKLMLSPLAKEMVLSRGYDPKYNARGLRRTIELDIILPIARAISTKQILATEDIVIGVKDNEFVFFARPFSFGQR